jgi:hypothetical protein
MAIPFLQEANVDGIIRVLRATGTILDDASAEAIRQLDNGLTEAEMDAIIGTLNLGGSGGKFISSPDDAFALVDSDRIPLPADSKINFFRVMRWQDDTTVDDPDNQMFEVYWPLNQGEKIEAVIGPDTGVLYDHGSDGEHYTSRLYLGAYREAGNPQAYAKIDAGPDSCVGGFAGMSLYNVSTWQDYKVYGFHRFYHGSEQRLQTGADTRLQIAPLAPTMVGGFGVRNSDPLLWIGDYYNARQEGIFTPQPSECLIVEQTTKGWMVQEYSGVANEWVNFVGTDADYKFNLVVNGNESSSVRTPNNTYASAFTVFSSESSTQSTAGFTQIPTSHTNVPVVTIRSYDEGLSANKYPFLRCEQRDGGGWERRFHVDNIGNVYADGSYGTPSSDVAEWIAVDDDTYAYGTVLVIGGDDMFTASTQAEDTKLAGVVAKKPGMEFGHVPGDPSEGKLPMTVCGITPVKCTTAAGAIAPGDRIVSSTDGMAQKSGADPAAGTILGKSLGTLEQPGEDPETGEVSCLIILQ